MNLEVGHGAAKLGDDSSSLVSQHHWGPERSPWTALLAHEDFQQSVGQGKTNHTSSRKSIFGEGGGGLARLGDVQFAVKVLDNEVPNCPMGPVVDIGATYSDRVHSQKNLMKESLNAKQHQCSKRFKVH